MNGSVVSTDKGGTLVKSTMGRFKEVFWLAGTFLATFLVALLVFGSDLSFWNTPIDINIHDTYFVFDGAVFSLVLFVFMLFGLYLLRSVGTGFAKADVTLVFIISTVLLMVLLGFFLYGVYDIYTISPHSVTTWGTVFYALLMLWIGLACLLVLSVIYYRKSNSD